MYKILIVEDDLEIARRVAKQVEKWNYDVFYITEFKTIKEQFISINPHLLILDVNLPYFDGFYWCDEIRKVSKIPIIFISNETDKMKMVMGMSMGGDDYITKPFDIDVLISKIQAVLRRTYSYSGQTDILEHNGAMLNLSDATITYDKKALELTKNDFRVMKALFQSKGKIVTRDTIMKSLWDNDVYIDDNTLSVNIARLRKKLETIGLVDFIKTKKSIGYFI